MLLISCHILYTYCHFLLSFMPTNTLEVEELYVPEGTITVRDNDLCMTQTGSL